MPWSTTYQGIVETLPDAVLLVESGGVVAFANPRAADLFGRPREEMVGSRVEEFVPGEIREQFAQLREQFESDPDALHADGGLRLVSARRHDGSTFPAEIMVTSLDTDHGRFIMAVVRDVTERLHLQAESVRLRDELIATVSHELRTPLTSIIGYAELMADLDADMMALPARKLLTIIQRNADRELKLVDDLLTMAFLDDNRMQVNRAPVLLGDVARKAFEDVKVRAMERSQDLAFTVMADGPVLGDALRLEQAIENLLDNAVKFTDLGGSILVHVSEADGLAQVSVHDNGMGFTSDEALHVFDRLYRTPGAAAAQVQGAGLGLAIVKAIVEGHGGTVSALGGPGGSVFTLSMPLAAGASRS